MIELSTMQDVIQRQKAAHRAAPYTSEAVRRSRLERLLAMIVDNEDRIADAAMADFGYRSPDQSFFVEVMASAKPAKEALKNLKKWMRPEKRKVDVPFALAGAKAAIHYHPLGTIGCISPWNFPFNLTYSPLAGIFAAGNRAMLKPSEITAHSAALIAELARQNFDEDELAVFTGGPEIAAEFAALPFDHLLYTGGEHVASKILHAAADNLTPVTLELGGKSPVIVGKGANLKAAATRVAFGKILNGGQICLAPDHVYVPRQHMDAFETLVASALQEMLPSGHGGTDMVSIVNDKHAERLRSYLADAEARGVRVVRPPITEELDGNFMAPTLLIDPPLDIAVMKEEIFGPVLPVIPYDSIDEVTDQLSGQEAPLALYIFGKDKAEIDHLVKNSRSGAVSVNDVVIQYTVDDLPFGGVGMSGMGAYHGIHGFKQFSHARAVYRHAIPDVTEALRPPFGKAFHRMTRFLLKHG